DPSEALQAVTGLPRGQRGHFIVQFDAAPDAEIRSALEAGGVKLLQYINNDAWYASVEGGIDASQLQARRLNAAWRIEAADRLSPALYRRAIPRHAMLKDG